jgi:hypothetical protein
MADSELGVRDGVNRRRGDPSVATFGRGRGYDRSWMVSFLWDADWACIGGSDDLIGDLENDPVLAPNVGRVDTEQDATAPATGRVEAPPDPASRSAATLIGGSGA